MSERPPLRNDARAQRCQGLCVFELRKQDTVFPSLHHARIHSETRWEEAVCSLGIVSFSSKARDAFMCPCMYPVSFCSCSSE